MTVREAVGRLFRLRPFRRPGVKARLIALIPAGEDGAPATPGLADIRRVLQRQKISPDEVR